MGEVRPFDLSWLDLVEHAELLREHHKVSAQLDLLGLMGGDAKVVGLLRSRLSEINRRLSPLQERLDKMGVITVTPYKVEIDELSSLIRGELEKLSEPEERSRVLSSSLEELKNFSGNEEDLSSLSPLARLLFKRASLNAQNFDRRQAVAKANFLLNSPKYAFFAKYIKQAVETGRSRLV